MQNDAATLQCPNEFCKAPNRQTDRFCQVCGTPLLKRYLWAVGEGIEAYQLGNLVADRYLLKSNRILLDTKPGLLPETPFSEISTAIKPYLRLVSYRLQVPQVYGLVPLGKERTAGKILLLEQAPIYTDAVPLEGQLLPELTTAWKDATSMRQLNWLWQIATLWQPFSTEGVASSLLEPQFLRVEGALMRLLQLQPDRGSTPTLSQLGQMWSKLVASSRPSIAEFLEQLCHSLIKGEVQSAEKLIAVLDGGLAEVGRSLLQSTFTIATRTDKGPSRQRNEDACYPPSGTTATTETRREESRLSPVVIVCDGIGGHEGGNVASNLAIQTIQQQIQQMPLDDTLLDASTLSSELERSARVANDKISQRNDNEHRHGRQRMGTTLVMALARSHEIYITHVGDSRAYWITRTGCHQVTLDDDVASREVRLGYALYRDALQQASSGSLVQALGMSSSVSLHPTVQRFVLDEDCVFLLCSDGLSDYDRVEQSWETEILPILDGKVDVATATQRLVEIGNTQNGHDNVTVGLVYCQVKFSEPESTLSSSLAGLGTLSLVSDSPGAASVLEEANTLEPSNAAFSKLNTQLLPSQRTPKFRVLPVLLGLVLLVSLASGLLAYLLKQDKLPRLTTAGSSPIDAQPPRSSVSPDVKPQGFSSTLPSLKKGALIQTKSEIVLSQIVLRPDQAMGELRGPFGDKGEKLPPRANAPQPQQRVTPIQGILPVGSVLQVLDKQPLSEQDLWLNLKVCSTPSTERSGVTKPGSDKNDTTPKTGNIQSSPVAPNSRLLQPKDKGWIREAEIEPYYLPLASLELAQRVNCPAVTENKE